MNKKNLLVPFVLGAIALGSCTDDNYDLSNIDDTARFEVKDYVLPVNVKQIKLSKVIDINEDNNGQIKSVVDPVTGKKTYAVLETGTFKSDPIDIPSFSTGNINIPGKSNSLNISKYLTELEERAIQQVENYFGITRDNPLFQQYYNSYKPTALSLAWASLEDDFVIAEFDIKVDPTSFSATSSNVTEAVQAIDHVSVETKLGLRLSLDNDFASVIQNIRISGLKLQFPKGLELTVKKNGTKLTNPYNPLNGELVLGDIAIVNGVFDGLEIEITSINAQEAGVTLVPGNKDQKGVFSFASELRIFDGCKVSIRKKDFAYGKTVYDLKDDVVYTWEPRMDAIKVKDFSGKIQYDIKQVNVDPVKLNDLPDFLNDYDTQIFLDNPQIYLAVNNPLYKYALKAQAGLKITPQKRGEVRSAKEASIEMVADRKDNVICLSPVDPGAGKYYDNMAVTHHEPYVGLRDVVAVTKADGTIKNGGVPDQINVELVDPQVPTQSVNQFRLGETLDPVVGNYTFYAPLAFADGTLIMYKDSDNGWGNDDNTLEKIGITKLQLTAKATSDIPLEATLTVKALGKNGLEIKDVSFSNVKVSANAQGQDVTFNLVKGVLTGLDGVEFHATVLANGGKSIEPEQTIKFDDVKVVVSGYYDEVSK